MSFILKESMGVRYYVSTLLPCPHAFSTRFGGVSELPHLRSMNIGCNRGDAPGNPEKNIALLTRAVGLPGEVISAKQVHGSELLYVASPPAAGAPKPELDGFYTDKTGVTLCVKTADCLPILFCDAGSGNVAAVHAGWRGSALRIAAKGVEALVSLGARRENILCAIGPSIRACCFEVKEDFITAFTECAGDCARRFIQERGGRTYADLQGFNRAVLLEAGVLPGHIDISPLCTCCHPDVFFSHRKTGGVRGTMGAMISKERAAREA